MTENLPVTDGISDDKIIPTPPPTPFAQLRLPAELRKRFALSSEASNYLLSVDVATPKVSIYDAAYKKGLLQLPKNKFPKN